MNEFDDLGNKHGYWEGYNVDGNIWYKGYFKNGNVQGFWEWYQGEKISSKGNYIEDGIPKGYWPVYEINEVLREKIFHL